ncbi:MAG: DUF305 domain-containing protein [Anaerolineae bacterium]|nr:DUF305 domain-containing protein [Anaerolineae bacterium]
MKTFRWSMIAMVIALLVGGVMVSADAPVEGRAGRAEVRFLEGMIDHHMMALMMASDCLAKASSDGLKSLCQAIIDAQTAEIEVMRGWLKAWYSIDYANMPMMDNMGGMMGGMMGDEPMMMMGMMAGLSDLTGTEYDIAWLEAMIDHHDDALHMSERLLRRVEHADLRDLAQNIIRAQSAEIEMMEGMIRDLSS